MNDPMTCIKNCKKKSMISNKIARKDCLMLKTTKLIITSSTKIISMLLKVRGKLKLSVNLQEAAHHNQRYLKMIMMVRTMKRV